MSDPLACNGSLTELPGVNSLPRCFQRETDEGPDQFVPRAVNPRTRTQALQKSASHSLNVE